MHRSGWITGAIVAQALWAAFLISLAIFLLDLTRTNLAITRSCTSGQSMGLYF